MRAILRYQNKEENESAPRGAAGLALSGDDLFSMLLAMHAPYIYYNRETLSNRRPWIEVHKKELRAHFTSLGTSLKSALEPEATRFAARLFSNEFLRSENWRKRDAALNALQTLTEEGFAVYIEPYLAAMLDSDTLR